MKNKTKQDLINCANMLFTFNIITQENAVNLIKQIETQQPVESVKKESCPKCHSTDDIRRKPVTFDCMECGYTWQSDY